MPTLHYKKTVIFLLVFVIFSAALQLGMNHFIYHRADMLGEPWRWWTANWVHVGWRHYMLNMLAFVFIAFVFPHVTARSLGYCLLVFSPLLTIALYVCMPDIYAYAGLSGILHGIYIYIALQSLAIPRERKFAMLVLVCIFLKVGWEKLNGFSETAQLIQTPVLLESHQIGLLIGIVASIAQYLWMLVVKRGTKSHVDSEL
jgi:rhomboid family GlyGly-CTERM serine protease